MDQFWLQGDAIVRDLRARTNLVAKPNGSGGYKFANSASFRLSTRRSALIKITPLAPVTQYLADAAGNTVTGGTRFANNNAATDGRVASLGGNGGSIIFNKITVPSGGTEILVNRRKPITVNFPATSSDPKDFSKIGAVIVELPLSAGVNIQLLYHYESQCRRA